jgi:hypothetical protein
MFVDESGDDNLATINPQFPVLGIGGVIFDEAAYLATENQKIKDFKIAEIGNDATVLHSYDIRKKQKDFAFLNDPARLASFLAAYQSLVGSLNFSFVSRIIDKQAHLTKYPNPYNPYEWVMELILESYSKILYRRREQGKIIVEARGGTQDRALRHAYNLVMQRGTNYVSANQLQNTIMSLSFAPKTANINGLQIADISIYTVTATVLYQKFNRRDYLFLRPKFDLHHGLKTFP